MKRSAILLASTAMLLAGPAGAQTHAPLHRPTAQDTVQQAGNHILLAQQEGELPAVDPQAADPQADELRRQQEEEAARQAEQAKQAAQEEAEQQLKEQRATQQDAKRKADRAAEEAAEAQEQVEEKARRQADQEAAKQVEEAEKRAQDEKAKRVTEEAQREAEAETEKRAEEAKKATDAEIRETEEAQEKAAERAKRETRAAQRAAEEEAAKAAEQAKRQVDRAVRQQEEQEQAAPTPDPESAPAEDVEESAPAPAQPAPEQSATPEQAAPPPPADQAEQPMPEPDAPAPDDGARAEQPRTKAPSPSGEAAPQPENAAPALDSAKEAAPAVPKGGEPSRDTQTEPAQSQPLQPKTEGAQEATPAPATPGDTAEQPAQPPAPAPATPPANDAEAQQLESPIRVESVRAEEGRRIERAPRRERSKDAQVLQQIDNRTVVEVNNNIYVESPDRPRLSRDAREVYYEDLPRQRTRETIVRPNGAQIVTIRNRYGDVVQRSRILPDGSEVLLSYAPDDDRERPLDWRDPGEDLPPLQLAIPVNEYIFDDQDAPEDEIYDFLALPPVERVERPYSIDEVKRSARIRDKLRRIDLDTITFAFGSADIAEDQIARMENVANAMQEVLKKNPAETFLIEGHTDAVGSDRANLVLSDRRAEAVAVALTNVFEIPPENMATQGYGERYLKISTQEPEQQNRRVAIRRITPLIAPMASK